MRKALFIAAIAVAGVTGAGAGTGRPDAALDRADERHHQRGVRRAGHAPRAAAGAVPVRAAALRVPGALPRSRSDGETREGIRLLQRHHRGLSDRPDLAADRRRAVDDDPAAGEDLRPERHPGGGRLHQRERRHHGRPRERRAGNGGRTSRGRTSKASSSSRSRRAASAPSTSEPSPRAPSARSASAPSARAIARSTIRIRSSRRR